MADEWYYACDGKQIGPIAGSALREMAAGGALKPSDLVWTEGMSQWAPAGTTRGLFPTAAQVPSSSEIPSVAPRPAAPRREPRNDRSQDDFDRPRRIQRQPQGMSTGAKLGIAGAIAFLVLGTVFAAFIVVAIFAAEKQRQQKTVVFRPQGFQQPPGQQVPFQPQPLPGFNGGKGVGVNPGGPGAIPLNGSYAIDLLMLGQGDEHFVEFNQNELVHITVLTSNWGIGKEPDVDLFVFDPFGNQVASDILPWKDCDVSFVAGQKGRYKIVVRLVDGNRAHCTVRY